ncbi:hypothetical protein QP414_12635 [Corynebacterium simulans]|uniref:hypothetical protein n=1 Tax=Corynebacterium simulans TaxID=146827 RepID=UPI00254F1B79|nr:hypothetical protein [Corynebacterium simulans]MDK7140129.1 hypothetical protein [Corynebacterium simulans]
MNHDDFEPPQETPGVPHGPRQRPGPQRPDDISPRPKTPPNSRATEEYERSTTPSFSADELRENRVSPSQIIAYLQENHLHLPMLTPDIDEVKEMRKNTPELYHAYVKAIDSQIDADHTARTAPYKEPGKIARLGQITGLIAILGVLVFCAYLAHLGHIIPAGLIAAFNLVALAGVFASGSQESNGDKPAN